MDKLKLSRISVYRVPCFVLLKFESSPSTHLDPVMYSAFISSPMVSHVLIGNLKP